MRRGLGVAAACLLVASALWWASGESGQPGRVLRLPASGRAEIALASIDARSIVRLELELPDNALPPSDPARRATGESVRIAAQGGRSLSATARYEVDADGRPLLSLDLDGAFLSHSPDLYLIQLEAADSHPIDLRRYVLTVR